jgi:sterol 14alpha-demethylase
VFLQVFTVPLLHMRMTFIVGPKASHHFYNARDDLMSQKEVYGYSVPTFGNDVVFAVDEKVRAEQFQMLANALKSSKMSSYVPEFTREARDFFTPWGESGEIDFLDQFNELVLFTASSTIMGKEVRENMFKEVTGLYHLLDQGAQCEQQNESPE